MFPQRGTNEGYIDGVGLVSSARRALASPRDRRDWRAWLRSRRNLLAACAGAKSARTASKPRARSWSEKKRKCGDHGRRRPDSRRGDMDVTERRATRKRLATNALKERKTCRAPKARLPQVRPPRSRPSEACPRRLSAPALAKDGQGEMRGAALRTRTACTPTKG